MSEITMWRYHIPPEDGLSGWGTFILDSTGFFAAVTDFGNFAYRWTHHGRKDFREFIIELARDPYYLLGKVRPSGEVYNGEKTLKSIWEHIREYRRCGWYTKEFAREEFNLIRECDDLDAEHDFYDWVRQTNIQDAYEHHQTAYRIDDLCFADGLMPRLAEAIKAEFQKLYHEN
ncbi:hypothetical protein [Acetonema longum]|uniref:Uncharacterized protein n=1 Tax=Acetonema longum DSM 6540 TaxID=1009370 RepID=F7NKE3_9FIRM|nr:hypothetical protein [Acetonema longum]EGO63584.1 hypothetical protein ALO_12781 [Acetonema longum DSM 6540]